MTIQLGIIGIGGFAGTYLNQIEKETAEGRAVLAAAAIRDPEQFPENRANLHRIPADTRVYEDAFVMLEAEQGRLDAILIPTGIGTHKLFTVAAAEAGFNVAVEKPPAGTVEDVLAMVQATAAADRLCSVGFQHVSSPHFRDLKTFIAQGGVGRVTEIRHIGLWRRLDSYYERNDWAGEVRHNNTWIFDGPLNNPLSHQMNNALYLASDDPQLPAQPARVRAEFYRGHRNIVGEDTDCVEVECTNGVRIHYYATLCALGQSPPQITVTGSSGAAQLEIGQPPTAQDTNGRTLPIPSAGEGQAGSIHNLIAHLTGECPLYCPISSTIPFMKVMNGAYESAGRIIPIAEDHLEIRSADDSTETVIRNISEAMHAACRAGHPLSAMDLPWAADAPSEWFELEGYREFSGRLKY